MGLIVLIRVTPGRGGVGWELFWFVFGPRGSERCSKRCDLLPGGGPERQSSKQEEKEREREL